MRLIYFEKKKKNKQIYVKHFKNVPDLRPFLKLKLIYRQKGQQTHQPVRHI